MFAVAEGLKPTEITLAGWNEGGGVGRCTGGLRVVPAVLPGTADEKV